MRTTGERRACLFFGSFFKKEKKRKRKRRVESRVRRPGRLFEKKKKREREARSQPPEWGGGRSQAFFSSSAGPNSHDLPAQNAARKQRTSSTSETSGPRASWSSKSARRPLPWAKTVSKGIGALVDRPRWSKKGGGGRGEEIPARAEKKKGTGGALVRSPRPFSRKSLYSSIFATVEAVNASKPSNVPKERPCAGRQRRPVLVDFEKRGDTVVEFFFSFTRPREALKSSDARRNKKASLRSLSRPETPLSTAQLMSNIECSPRRGVGGSKRARKAPKRARECPQRKKSCTCFRLLASSEEEEED